MLAQKANIEKVVNMALEQGENADDVPTARAANLINHMILEGEKQFEHDRFDQAAQLLCISVVSKRSRSLGLDDH